MIKASIGEKKGSQTGSAYAGKAELENTDEWGNINTGVGQRPLTGKPKKDYDDIDDLLDDVEQTKGIESSKPAPL